MNYKIFLSHKTIDKPYVEEIANALNDFGFSSWFDKKDIKIGVSLDEKIQDGMEESCAVVFFITPNYDERDEYLAKELQYAIKKGSYNFVNIVLLIPDINLVCNKDKNSTDNMVYNEHIKELENKIPNCFSGLSYGLILNPLEAFIQIVKAVPPQAMFSILETGMPIFKNKK